MFFGFAILCDGSLEFAVLMQDQAKIAVGFPEGRPKVYGITIAEEAAATSLPSACRAMPMS